jgi:hypothetical protein
VTTHGTGAYHPPNGPGSRLLPRLDERSHAVPLSRVQAIAHPVRRVVIYARVRARLPAVHPAIAAGPLDGRAWPALPAAEFTTFLAGCRRHLSRVEFGMVAEVYYDTAEAPTPGWPTASGPGWTTGSGSPRR